MILKKSINRLAWRFTPQDNNEKPNKFTPNDNDIKAVNDIIEWVNRQKELTVNSNKLFAKLYIYFLDNEIKKYDTTVFDDIPQKQLSRILQTPLDLFFVSFKNSFNHNLTKKFFDNHNVELKTVSSKEDKNNLDDITDIDIENWIKNEYDLLFIESELKEMISEALNRYSNYD